jgi:hypothetical protein
VSVAAERVRLVACECGRCKLLIDPRGGRKYAPGHKQGAYRERLKRAAAAQGVPAAVSFATLNATNDPQTRNGDALTRPQAARKRHSGRTISYRKAVNVLAAQLYLWDASKTRAQAVELAETILRDALPARQRRETS